MLKDVKKTVIYILNHSYNIIIIYIGSKFFQQNGKVE